MPIITPGFEGPKLDKTIELTRIMLLSPIFLAMGAVATSVLNAGGRFAASAIAPVVYNLAIIGGALILGPSLGVDGPRAERRGGLARPSARPAATARPDGIPLRRPRSSLRIRRRARR